MQEEQSDILCSVKSIVNSHLTLIQEAKESNEQIYTTSKMWIKQAFNNLFQNFPKHILDTDIDKLLGKEEREQLLNDPLQSIEFFKTKFKREIEAEEWEDEPEQPKTPPKRELQNRIPLTSNNQGFRKHPATKLQSQKKAISAKVYKFQKKF